MSTIEITEQDTVTITPATGQTRTYEVDLGPISGSTRAKAIECTKARARYDGDRRAWVITDREGDCINLSWRDANYVLRLGARITEIVED